MYKLILPETYENIFGRFRIYPLENPSAAIAGGPGYKNEEPLEMTSASANVEVISAITSVSLRNPEFMMQR